MIADNNWEQLWCQLEQEGNIGLEFVINPFLYREMANFLINHTGSYVLDFGAGTNILAIQFMKGNQRAIPALKPIANLAIARTNVDKFIGIESSSSLVLKATNYLRDLGWPSNIEIQHFEMMPGNKTCLFGKGA